MKSQADWPEWKPRLCACGHTSGDHVSARGYSPLAERRGGLCLRDGCGCRAFAEAEELAA